MALTDADEFHGPVKPGQERLDNCRLANSRLTADQHQLTATGLCRRQGGPQRGKFGVTPDEACPCGLRWFKAGERLCDIGDEPVTAAMHGADDILAFTVVTGRSSRGLDAAGDCGIGDEPVVPDLVHELLFGYQAVSMPYEVGEHLQHLRLHVLRYSCAAQLEAVQIHRHVRELVHPANRVRPCAEPTLPCSHSLHETSTPAPRLSAAMFLTSW